MSVSIIVPRPIPPGQRMGWKELTQYPCCDRCRRESSDRNPVTLTERPSEILKEALNGITRRDALCYECRLALAGKL